MQLQLKSTDTIQEVQEKFKAIYSHLKPEFFKKFHKDSEDYAKKEQFKHDVKIGDLIGNQENIVINIEKSMSTEAFEKMFEEQYQLHVQLMRLQKDTWLITTNTQDLTLEEQNNRGIAADQEIASESIKDIDAE